MGSYRLGDLPGHSARIRCRPGAVVVLALAVRERVHAVAVTRRRRRGCRRHRTVRFCQTIRNTGIGTPAPAFPTRHLVITGIYRHVRNPMYLAVIATILGQGALFGNVAVLEYGGVVWLFHLFVLVYEEPTLRSTFGTEYESYSAAVPQWIPRLMPLPLHPRTEEQPAGPISASRVR
jgi:hypothetical protein